MDLLTATGPFFTFWENSDGSGLLWVEHTIADNFMDAKQIVSGDLDGDGDLDVVVSENQPPSQLAACENLDSIGHQWAEHPMTVPYSSWPEYIRLADIDCDGDLDFFLWTKGMYNFLVWYENLGSWSWDVHFIQNPMNYATSLSQGDFDADGDIDIAIAMGNGGNGMRLYMNMDGVGGEWAYTVLQYVPLYTIRYLHSVDIDDDGDLDITGTATRNYYCNELVIYENLDGVAGCWELHRLETTLFGARFRSPADINGDGYPDFPCNESQPQIYWFDVIGRADTGWVQSAILDVVGYPDWDNISWISTEPAGTDLYFLLRSSNDPENMGSWCDTIFDPGSLAGYIDSTHRYMQYLACLTAETEDSTPVLDEVSIEWSNMGTGSGENHPGLSVSAAPNPFSGSVSIAVSTRHTGNISLHVFDISGKLIRTFADLSGDVCVWDCRDSNGIEIPDGVYLVRCVVGGISASLRLVKL
jgi:hypothetical protein